MERRINQLLQRAKALEGNERITIATLQGDKSGCYVLSVHYWDDIDGSGERIVTSTHETRDDARRYFDSLAAGTDALLLDLCGR